MECLIFNAQYRERVGLNYDLVKANVERIVVDIDFRAAPSPDRGLGRDARLASLGEHARRFRRHRGEAVRRAGETTRVRDRSHPRMWGAASWLLPVTHTRRDTRAARSRRTTWRRSTASGTPMAPSRTVGATSMRMGSTSRAHEEWKSSDRPGRPSWRTCLQPVPRTPHQAMTRVNHLWSRRSYQRLDAPS